MKIISLFSGCGGLDLGFKKAGYDLVWANEYDKGIWATFAANHPDVYLDKRSIIDIPSREIPDDIDGIIGGPPCQSWSEAGARRGINDERGKLFYEYVRIIKDKQPLFFLAENVPGLTFQRNSLAFKDILASFSDVGYNLYCQVVNAADYGVPQDRKRVIIVGFHQSIDSHFILEPINDNKLTLKEAIYDLWQHETPPEAKNKTKGDRLTIPNHEYMLGSFSSIYMSRNRVRMWHEQSFTIQAGGRHAPIHPQAPVMTKVDKDKFIFAPGYEHLYRRLSVRECARVQTFPDDFVFHYNLLADGYKMIGNAVPVELGFALGKAIHLGD